MQVLDNLRDIKISRSSEITPLPVPASGFDPFENIDIGQFLITESVIHSSLDGILVKKHVLDPKFSESSFHFDLKSKSFVRNIALDTTIKNFQNGNISISLQNYLTLELK